LDRLRLLIRRRLRVAPQVLLIAIRCAKQLLAILHRFPLLLLLLLLDIVIVIVVITVNLPRLPRLPRLSPLLRGELLQRRPLGVLRPFLRRRHRSVGQLGGLLLAPLLLSQQLRPLPLLLEPLLLQGHLHLALELRHVRQALALLLAEHVAHPPVLVVVIAVGERELGQNLSWGETA